MIRLKLIPFLVVFIFFLAACQTGSLGPQAWIDQPAERNNPHTVQSYVFQAHSSDEDGIVILEFLVNDEVYNTFNTGGAQFEEGTVEWTPPEPGTYMLSVRATDGAGNTGNAARMKIVVLGEDDLAAINQQGEIIPDEDEPVQGDSIPDEDEPVQGDSIPDDGIDVPVQPEIGDIPEEPEPVPEEPGVVASMNSNCRSGPGTAYSITGFLNMGEEAEVVGRASDSSWWVISLSNKPNCWIAANLVETIGPVGEAPIIKPPPPPIVEQDPSDSESEGGGDSGTSGGGGGGGTADTIPPNISFAALSGTNIYLKACGNSYAKTTTLTIEVTDASGIGFMGAVWSIGAEGGSVSFKSIGGNRYTALFGNVSTLGTMSITATIIDNAGNHSGVTKNVTVVNCIN